MEWKETSLLIPWGFAQAYLNLIIFGRLAFPSAHFPTCGRTEMGKEISCGLNHIEALYEA